MSDTVFRKLVSVSVGEDSDGPSVALIELSAVEIRRIRRLAKAAKNLMVTAIEDYGVPTEFFTGDYTNPNDVTDKTTIEECGLLINDDNEVTATLAKGRLAGASVHSEYTFNCLKSLLESWEHSVDCERMCVDRDSFHYRGYLRNCDVSWSTDSIMISELPVS